MNELDKFSASPVGDRVEFKKLFELAKEKYPELELEYIGYRDGKHYLQLWGDPTEFWVPSSESWKPLS